MLEVRLSSLHFSFSSFFCDIFTHIDPSQTKIPSPGISSGLANKKKQKKNLEIGERYLTRLPLTCFHVEQALERIGGDRDR